MDQQVQTSTSDSSSSRRTCSKCTCKYEHPFKSTTRRQSPERYYCHIPGCSSSFRRPSDLARHRRSLHGPKRLCSYQGCTYATGRVDKMKEHVRKIHKWTATTPTTSESIPSPSEVELSIFPETFSMPDTTYNWHDQSSSDMIEIPFDLPRTTSTSDNSPPAFDDSFFPENSCVQDFSFTSGYQLCSDVVGSGNTWLDSLLPPWDSSSDANITGGFLSSDIFIGDSGIDITMDHTPF